MAKLQTWFRNGRWMTIEELRRFNETGTPAKIKEPKIIKKVNKK